MRRRTRSRQQPLGIGAQAVQGSVWNVSSTLVLLPVNLVTGVVLARLLGPTGFGELAVLLVFLALAGPLTDLGFGQALLQWSGRALGAGETAEADTLFRKALGFHLLVQLPVLLAGGAYLLQDETTLVLGLFVVLQLSAATFGNASARLVAENRSVTRAKLDFVSGLLGNAVACGLAVAGASPAEIYVGRALASLLPSLPILWLLTAAARRSLLRPLLPRALPHGYWRFARGFWVAAALGSVIGNRSEVFVLRAYGETAAVGVFAVVFGLAVQATAPLGIVQANLTPAMTYLSGRDERGLEDVVARSVRIFGLGASAVLALSGTLVMLFPLLYGRDYEGAAPLLVPLLVAVCLQTALAPYSALAVVRRRRRLLPVVQLIAVVADIGLAALLVPALGIVGAVVGAAAGLVLVNTGLLLAEVGSTRAALRVVVAAPLLEGALCLSVSIVAAWPLREQPLLAALVCLLIATATFAGLVRALRWGLVRTVVGDVTPLLPARVGSGLTAVARAVRLG